MNFAPACYGSTRLEKKNNEQARATLHGVCLVEEDAGAALSRKGEFPNSELNIKTCSDQDPISWLC